LEEQIFSDKYRLKGIIGQGQYGVVIIVESLDVGD